MAETARFLLKRRLDEQSIVTKHIAIEDIYSINKNRTHHTTNLLLGFCPSQQALGKCRPMLIYRNNRYTMWKRPSHTWIIMGPTRGYDIDQVSCGGGGWTNGGDSFCIRECVMFMGIEW